MIQRLLRMRCLDRYRVQGALPVAVDATGTHTFASRHCPHCLSQVQGDVTIYYHMVVEAKIVTPDGLALSLGTEFVENRPGEAKQDCESKAFHRLADKLKRAYPRLQLCLLLDAGYAQEPVLNRCKENGWHFVIVFKEGSFPERFDEFQRLKGLAPNNQRQEHPAQGVTRDFAWVDDLPIGPHHPAVLECRETIPGRDARTWVWLCSLQLNSGNVSSIASKIGRQRWKIENQGFNIQKNHGFNLEHAYSRDEVAGKNFYLLLQIAHIIDQLMEYGSLLAERAKRFGTKRAFARRLLEAIRTIPLAADALDVALAAGVQIRLRNET